MKYRRDIDGLRALSVLGVLFYHLDLPLFQGGFVGVDVFFVISGYLISKKLINQQRNRELSLIKFYGNRVRRLLPALLTCIILTFVASIWILSPSDFFSLSRAAILSIFPFSNILYYTESGYFDLDKFSKPLLHTWSLGVEEQFYLLWPIFISLILSKTNHLWSLISAVGILSLASSIFVINVDPQAAFFLPQYRIFEFAIGALAIPISSQFKTKKIFYELIITIGLALILAPMFIYSDNLTFPGHFALLPCIGTALVLLGGESTKVGALLRNQAASYLGRISYSIYLVHWPLIVLYKYHSIEPLDAYQKFFLFISSILVAAIIHHSIELPCWKGKIVSRFLATGKGITSLAIVVGITLGFLTHVYLSKGWAWKNKIDIEPWDQEKMLSSLRWGDCFISKKWHSADNLKSFCYSSKKEDKNILLIGSSHAGDLYPGIKHALADWKIYQVVSSGCIPSTTKLNQEPCDTLNQKIFSEIIPQFSFDIVILAGYANDKLLRLQQTLEKLEELKQDYVVIGPRVKYNKNVHHLLESYGSIKGFDNYLSKFINYPKEFSFVKKTNYFSLLSVLCSPNKKCKWKAGNHLVHMDNEHFTVEGSLIVGKEFAKWLEKRNKQLSR